MTDEKTGDHTDKGGTSANQSGMMAVNICSTENSQATSEMTANRDNNYSQTLELQLKMQKKQQGVFNDLIKLPRNKSKKSTEFNVYKSSGQNEIGTISSR